MLNKRCEKRINDIISILSIDQKLSQMFIVGYPAQELPKQLFDWVHNYLGGIIFFRENIESPVQIARLISNLQVLSTLGMFVSVDQEGGFIERITGVTQIPTPMALAASEDQEAISVANDILARELEILGFNLNYTPVVDVNTNPQNPVIGIRSFGDDPLKVSNNALIVIESMRKHNIIPVAKHFPGHGSVNIDSHKSLPSIGISYDDLCRNHLFPFQEVIVDDIEMIMVAHLAIKQVTDNDTLPATFSEDVIKDLLFAKMSYEGVVISDDMNMRAITASYTRRNAAIKAINAGIDILLYRNYRDARVAYNYILSECKAGNISEERINQSLRKILALKMKYSVLKANYCPDEEVIDSEICSVDTIDTSEFLFDKTLSVYKQGVFDKNTSKLIISVDRSQLMHYKSEEELTLGSLITDAKEVKISINPTNDEIKNVLALVDSYDELIVVAYNAQFNKNQEYLIKELLKIKDVYILIAGSPYDACLFNEAKMIILSYGYSNGVIKSFNRLLNGEIEGNKNLPVKLLL